MILARRTNDTGIMNSHENKRELGTARAKYRGEIIPKPALAII